MAFTISGTLIVDETSGTQNSAAGGSDSTGNDVAFGLGFISSGVTAFDTLLAAVVTQDLTNVNVNVAVSRGTSADPDGDTMLSGFGADVIDLAFTNSTGGALSGVEALSAPGVSLLTVDGSKIYLYSYSVIAAARGLAADLPGVDENNVVFGLKGTGISGATANPFGDIVFAAYLQPTDASGAVMSSDAGAVGSKVWLVEYEEIKHPTTDPDEGLNLYNLYVSVSNRVDFSLEGAPSGQNLFLMYGDGSPVAGEAAIVVTGKAPINQSIDSSGITSGDTVNTGQGGGDTTIGTNNQMIDPEEGMYFSFVTLSADSLPLTVPNLDQNEADVEENIKFASYLGANEAIFTVVQLQPPKAGTMKLTALNNTDGTEKGEFFIDGLSDGTTADIHTSPDPDDLVVNITEVKISWSIKVQGKTFSGSHVFAADTGTVTFTDPDTGITRSVDFTGNTVTITGVVTGDEIDYKTATDHNRVLIENVGNTSDANLNAAFDIGGFSLIRSSVTPNQFSALTFQDDGPSISTTGTEPTATVDETVLATNATADFSVNFTSAFGADGAGTLTYALGISSVGANSGLTDTATGNTVFLFLESGVVVGREGTDAADAETTGDVVFTASVSASGVVTLDQQRAIVHPLAGSSAAAHDDNKTLAADTLITLTATKTDKDGDTASATLFIAQNLNFKDDGPSITASIADAPNPTVDETTLATNDSDSFAAQFTPTFGADGQGATPVTYALTTSGGLSGLVDTATGTAVYLFSEGGKVVGRVGSSGAGAIVFEIGVDASGNVSLDQQRAIVHTPDTGPDQALSMSGVGKVVLTATAYDKDGDSASAPLDITAQFVFKDDAPAIGPIADSVVDFVPFPGAGSSATKSLFGVVGADVKTSPYTITSFTATTTIPGKVLTGVASGGDTVVTYWDNTNGNGTIGDAGDTAYYQLTLNQTANAGAGSYTFKVLVAPPPTEIEFGFDLLPSGQNLFGIVGTTDVGLVVIGKLPVLNADNTFTNTSDTINTSQGGGNVTIGINNQMFDPGDGAYFTLVEDPVPSFLSGAPGGLDQNEADDADNIQYTGGTKEVLSTFTRISQIQGNDLATMKVTAIDMTGSPQEEDFVLSGDGDGLGQGTVRDILSVRVYDANGNKIEDTGDLAHFNSADVAVDLSGLTAVVSGLDAGYKIEWTTDFVHDQVLIECVSGKFDIGAFGTNQPNPTPDQILNFTARVTDGDGDYAEDSFQVTIDGTGIYDDLAPASLMGLSAMGLLAEVMA